MISSPRMKDFVEWRERERERVNDSMEEKKKTGK
jgi:hypothetical protein